MSDITRRDLLRTGLALSASSLVANSALARANALLARYPGVASADADSAVSPREHLLFDFGWKFFQGHGSDPSRDLDFGKDQGDFAKSGEFEFAREKFDDSKWRPLNLPHDWAVELPFVHDELLQGHGYKPLGRRYPETSVGWYRRVFEIPQSDLGRRVVLEFDGAFRSALVFLNGYFLGPQRQRLRALPFRSHRLSELRRQELSRRALGCEFRRRLVLRRRRHLSPRVAHEDRRASSRQMGKLRSRGRERQ